MFEDNGGCKEGVNQHRPGREMRGARGTRPCGKIREEHFKQKEKKSCKFTHYDIPVEPSPIECRPNM